MFRPTDLFDLAETAHATLFVDCEYAWDALKGLKSYLTAHLKPGLQNRCEGVAGSASGYALAKAPWSRTEP